MILRELIAELKKLPKDYEVEATVSQIDLDGYDVDYSRRVTKILVDKDKKRISICGFWED